MTTTEPTTEENGDETHPSFGVVMVSRISAQPGVRLFDSSLPHRDYISLRISRATRTRSLHHDWIHPVTKELIEIKMSLAQWGSMVASFGQGSGTPVTLAWVNGEQQPEATHESRLAQTSREVADAARKSTEQVRAAIEAVEAAFERKAGRREMADLIRHLHHAGENAPSNMKYAADTLTRHAEDVVTKARADIEAAVQFGGSVLDAVPVLELEGDTNA